MPPELLAEGRLSKAADVCAFCHFSSNILPHPRFDVVLIIDLRSKTHGREALNDCIHGCKPSLLLRLEQRLAPYIIRDWALATPESSFRNKRSLVGFATKQIKAILVLCRRFWGASVGDVHGPTAVGGTAARPNHHSQDAEWNSTWVACARQSVFQGKASVHGLSMLC